MPRTIGALIFWVGMVGLLVDGAVGIRDGAIPLGFAAAGAILYGLAGLAGRLRGNCETEENR